jgi:hypothetical protein
MASQRGWRYNGLSVKWMFLFLLALAVLACSPLSNVCSTTPQPLLATDGGPLGCVQAEDCPRAGETYVCVTDTMPANQCVSCDANQCVLHVPVPCR